MNKWTKQAIRPQFFFFNVDHFFLSLYWIIEFVTTFWVFLAPRPLIREWTYTPCIRRRSLNHWTTRQWTVSSFSFKCSFVSSSSCRAGDPTWITPFQISPQIPVVGHTLKHEAVDLAKILQLKLEEFHGMWIISIKIKTAAFTECLQHAWDGLIDL